MANHFCSFFAISSDGGRCVVRMIAEGESPGSA
jgi:hypothetical protein